MCVIRVKYGIRFDIGDKERKNMSVRNFDGNILIMSVLILT